MKESDIKHEIGDFFVLQDRHEGRRIYTVYGPMKSRVASESLSSFEGDEDGLSLAIAHCDYKAKRDIKNQWTTLQTPLGDRG